jgi:hypothetical protein
VPFGTEGARSRPSPGRRIGGNALFGFTSSDLQATPLNNAPAQVRFNNDAQASHRQTVTRLSA